MRPEIALALVSLACLGTNDFLYRWGRRFGLRTRGFMLLQVATFLPVAAAAATWRGDLAWSPGLWYGFGNGFLAFAAFACVLRALHGGEALALAPVVRLNFAVTGGLTVWLLGEPLDATRMAGLGLAAAAILSGGGRLLRAGPDRRALGLALGATVLFGVMGLFYKLGLRAGAGPAALVTAQGLGHLALALGLAIGAREPVPRRGVALWLPAGCGLLYAFSYVSLAVAFTHGDAVVVAPIAQLAFVLTGVLAVAFLGERLTPGKVAGVVLAAGAVSLFAWE